MSSPVPPPDPLYVLRGTGSQVTAICSYEPFLLTGTQSGKIQIWDLKTRRMIHQSEHCQEEQSVLSIKSVGEQFLTHCRDGTVKMWQLIDHKLIPKGIFQCHSGTFFPMEVAINDDRMLMMVPGPETSEVDAIDINNKETISKLIVKHCGEKGYGMCMCAKFIHGKSNVVIGYENGSVALWNISTSSAAECNKLSCHNETVTALDYSEKCNRGVSGSVDDKLIIWTITEDSKLKEFKSLKITNPGVNVIKIRQDSKIFVVGGWDHNIRIFGLKKLQPLAILSFHRDSISRVDFSNDFLLFAASADQTISAWSIYR